jgi:hypothetical protein
MPLNLHISPSIPKYKNPIKILYRKLRAAKTSSTKYSPTVENIIFKENSEYANFISQINYQKTLQIELYNQIYNLLDQYKTSVNYTSLLEQQCQNIYKSSEESTEESIEVYTQPKSMCKQIMDYIYDCIDPSTKSWMKIIQGL